MKTVREVSKLAGVSVRTLQYYDSIGLLKPTAVTAAGYRLYDEQAVAYLQTIVQFRELSFSLSEIQALLKSSSAERMAAVRDRIRLLELKRERLNGQILLAEKLLTKGEVAMEPQVWDETKQEAYADEAQRRWGNTEAYRAYEKKDKAVIQAAGDGLMAHLAEFGKRKHLSPENEAVQKAVADFQEYITANFYPCSKEILAGLGELYGGDERFTKSIDAAGGDGTAAFVSAAIRYYCR